MPESQGKKLVLAVLYLPCSLDSGSSGVVEQLFADLRARRERVLSLDLLTHLDSRRGAQARVPAPSSLCIPLSLLSCLFLPLPLSLPPPPTSQSLPLSLSSPCLDMSLSRRFSVAGGRSRRARQHPPRNPPRPSRVASLRCAVKYHTPNPKTQTPNPTPYTPHPTAYPIPYTLNPTNFAPSTPHMKRALLPQARSVSCRRARTLCSSLIGTPLCPYCIAYRGDPIKLSPFEQVGRPPRHSSAKP